MTNLASRLCSAAEDGQILIDSNAAASVSGTTELADLGGRELKGFAASISVYAVAKAA